MSFFEEVKGVCPNCHKHSGFKASSSHIVWPQEYRPSYGGHVGEAPPLPRVRLSILVCLYCDKTVVTLEHEGEGKQAIPTQEVVYPRPAPRELSSEVPERVRSFYKEASLCESAGALRGAAVLYRAAVEQIAVAQGADGQGLKAQIKDLRKTGLDGELVDDLHEARMMGEDSVHAGLTYSPEEVADVAKLIEEATVWLYVQPAERQKYRAARQARRTDAGR